MSVKKFQRVNFAHSVKRVLASVHGVTRSKGICHSIFFYFCCFLLGTFAFRTLCKTDDVIFEPPPGWLQRPDRNHSTIAWCLQRSYGPKAGITGHPNFSDHRILHFLGPIRVVGGHVGVVVSGGRLLCRHLRWNVLCWHGDDFFLSL